MEEATKFLNPERLDEYMSTGVALGTKVLIAILILIVGSWIAKKVKNGIIKVGTKRPELDETLFNFLGSIARWVIMAFVFIAILNSFGFETTSIVAMLGAATVAIGLALQGAMSNLAAGVMLMIFRPYKRGDFVEGGSHFGLIEDINIFTTNMQTFDNQQIIIPNGKIWGDKIINHSHHPVRGVDIKINVAYNDDPEKARKIILDVLAAHPHVKSDPAPFVEVDTLTERAMEFIVRPFTDGEHYWDVRYSVPEQIGSALGKAGFTTPYPRMLMVQDK